MSTLYGSEWRQRLDDQKVVKADGEVPPPAPFVDRSVRASLPSDPRAVTAPDVAGASSAGPQAGLTGALLQECIDDGTIPKPPLMSWNEWQKWRKEVGRRPPGSSTREEGTMWRNTMRTQHGISWHDDLLERLDLESEGVYDDSSVLSASRVPVPGSEEAPREGFLARMLGSYGSPLKPKIPQRTSAGATGVERTAGFRYTADGRSIARSR